MKLLFVAVALIMAVNARLTAVNEWSSFKSTHNKSYNAVEEKVRFAHFQNNLRKIQEHNAKYEKGEVTYYLAINQFADWSAEEFKALLNTQVANKPNIPFIEKFEADPSFEKLDAIDWRKDADLGVKDQGLTCGSCWAFSTTGALEGQLAIHKKQRVPLSEQELVDCDHQNGGCKGGLMTDAFKYVQHHGLSSEKEYPYAGRDGRCKNLHNKQLGSIKGFVELRATESALVDALGQVGPISIAVDADLWQHYGGGVFNNRHCGTKLNHGVLAVGYDKDVFIVKNSWGKSWGENGYIRIQRGHNLCGLNLMNSYPKL